ncbi:cobalamin B12-binding domain-containing protein [Allokutzneria albata]|uniref:Methanogenic corrinoid protein MtbC1 n=1 Tax=Allokutzneria albata TaxID=211114 RepID=A0A1G9V9B0_ALLAB|nr:cobalamin B12-binding domain-containing protein [Allokutzneria albata]SDM68475.1 Methanogenic corrinoid protein MtbC1 [Allokutzneria albata]
MRAERYVSTYFEAIGAADTGSAQRQVSDLLEAGLQLDWIVTNVILPAQQLVGEAWENDTWNVAREHAATGISEQIIAVLGATQQELPCAKHLVAACVEHEQHSLPLRATATLLRGAGHRLTFLGASVPVADLRRYVTQVRPDAVLLSCMLAARVPDAERAIRALRGLTTRIIVGGPGFGPEGVWASRFRGEVTAARDATEVTRLLELPPPAQPFDPLGQPRPVCELDAERIRARRDDLLEHGMAVLGPLSRADDLFALFLSDSLGHLVDTLVAAVHLDNPAAFVEYLRWLRRVASRRGIPSAQLDQVLRSWSGQLKGMPKARRVIGAALKDAAPADT